MTRNTKTEEGQSDAGSAYARRGSMIREIPAHIPKADQWSGLLIRTEKDSQGRSRVFFFPSRLLSAHELESKDQGLQFDELIKAIDNMGTANLGISNAVLINNMDTIGTMGMRIVEFVSKKAIGNPVEILPERTDWRKDEPRD